jgi:hypothetical protein
LVGRGHEWGGRDRCDQGRRNERGEQLRNGGES